MIRIRPANDRGATRIGWLDSRHTFSFGDYHDPDQQGFRSLRVINEDRVKPAQGFGTHPHRDMEIVTYVIAGELAHRDSLGTGSTIRPGEIQRMTAGTGVLHSEMNPSPAAAVHFLQIWILPEQRGLAPSYEQKAIPRGAGVHLIGSREGGPQAVTIHQDVRLHAVRLPAGEKAEVALGAGRHAWVQVIAGALAVGETRLGPGDGAAVSAEAALALAAAGPDEVEALLFDLP
jgi:redox-sensitive bicupin YhaK (pirin superfamily)